VSEARPKQVPRRQMLRGAVGGLLGMVGVELLLGCEFFAPTAVPGQFGATIDAGAKSAFPPALPAQANLDVQGIFNIALAKAYLVHLSAETPLLLQGAALKRLLASESWTKDSDGSYWLALYQKCVHLGCRVPFRDDCHSFKCPCHGSHYAVDGEYLDGPAPRSLDRFALSFQGDHVIIDTGKFNNMVARPMNQTRLISTNGTDCSA